MENKQMVKIAGLVVGGIIVANMVMRGITYLTVTRPAEKKLAELQASASVDAEKMRVAEEERKAKREEEWNRSAERQSKARSDRRKKFGGIPKGSGKVSSRKQVPSDCSCSGMAMGYVSGDQSKDAGCVACLGEKYRRLQSTPGMAGPAAAEFGRAQTAYAKKYGASSLCNVLRQYGVIDLTDGGACY